MEGGNGSAGAADEFDDWPIVLAVDLACEGMNRKSMLALLGVKGAVQQGGCHLGGTVDGDPCFCSSPPSCCHIFHLSVESSVFTVLCLISLSFPFHALLSCFCFFFSLSPFLSFFFSSLHIHV